MKTYRPMYNGSVETHLPEIEIWKAIEFHLEEHTEFSLVILVTNSIQEIVELVSRCEQSHFKYYKPDKWIFHESTMERPEECIKTLKNDLFLKKGLRLFPTFIFTCVKHLTFLKSLLSHNSLIENYILVRECSDGFTLFSTLFPGDKKDHFANKRIRLS